MNNYNKKLFELFYEKKITISELKKKLDTQGKDLTSYLLDSLKNAILNHSEDDIESIVILLFEFKEIKTNALVDILIDLMSETWHYKHEDITRLFQKWRNPKTINVLYETTNKSFAYLEYDDSYALAVKCIWALGDIATADSFDKLKILSESTNPIIKENACYQLKKHAIT
ncbi:hypothetical protein [Enterobacter chengduensis]|uniref:hypothetical protein n=1 Tax=Enterobacter chengduensis TaxID=2494701 RepID=UPI0020061BF5|nr:hypothetical protein [Enterobacter chengduensis]MCK7426951.1 hypothetical protein [Enterobacter chengduensis]